MYYSAHNFLCNLICCVVYNLFSGNRKQELNDAVVTFIIKDPQPFSVVDNNIGFKELGAKLKSTPTSNKEGCSENGACQI